MAAIPRVTWRRPVFAILICATLAQTLLLVRLFYVDSRIEAAKWLQANLGPGETWGLISNFPGYGPRLEGAVSSSALRALSRELAPTSVFVAAAEDLYVSGPELLVIPTLYFERFLDSPEAAPEKAKFFSDVLGGRFRYRLAIRLQQHGIWRPPNEFLDPQVLIFRRVPSASPGS